MFAHLGGILGYIGWLPSLIIWLTMRERGPFVREQARTALNFQITAVITYVVIAVLDAMLPLPLFFLGFIAWVLVVVFSIMGGIAANKGESYKYPFSLDLIK